MHRLRVVRVLPILLLIGAAPGHRYTLDAAQSVITARVAFFGLASKTAHFPKASGGITLDPDTPERIDLEVRLDATALAAPDAVTVARLRSRGRSPRAASPGQRLWRCAFPCRRAAPMGATRSR